MKPGGGSIVFLVIATAFLVVRLYLSGLPAAFLLWAMGAAMLVMGRGEVVRLPDCLFSLAQGAVGCLLARNFTRALFHTIVTHLAQLGVGLVLSGHTHGGQLWPIPWLARSFYPRNAGHYQIGAIRFYVSRGVGTWGP